MPKQVIKDEAIKEAVVGSQYLAGTGETTHFDHHQVLQESDDLIRALFFSIVKETTGTEFFQSLKEVYDLSEKFHESQAQSDFDALTTKLGSLTNE